MAVAEVTVAAKQLNFHVTLFDSKSSRLFAGKKVNDALTSAYGATVSCVSTNANTRWCEWLLQEPAPVPQQGALCTLAAAEPEF